MVAVAIDCLQHMGLAGAVARRYRRAADLRGVDPEDLRSEALVALLRAARSYDSGRGATFGTFAFLVLRRELLAFLKRQHPHCSLPAGFEEETASRSQPGRTFNADLEQEDAEHIATLLSVLSPRPRALVELHFGMTPDGRAWTYQEIAERFGISRSRVGQIIGRALQIMREHAKQSGQTD